MKKIHFVVNARLPHKKAYGIQIVQTCESFAGRGYDVTLVCPGWGGLSAPAGAAPLPEGIRIVRLPSVPAYASGRLLFLASSVSFMFFSFLWLLTERIRGNLFLLYTIDMDSFSFFPYPLLGVPCVAEIHAPKRATFPCRFFFSRAAGVITLNSEIRAGLIRTFGLQAERCIAEPCGVSETWLGNRVSRRDARGRLGIAESAKVAAYVGRFYDWKGLDIIPAAARITPDVLWYAVGGSHEQFAKAAHAEALSPNVYVPGECANSEVPIWLAAADVLLVPWPASQKSYHQHVTPMKLFECMGAKRAVVAARHPTITSVVSEEDVLLYRPGDARDFASRVREAAAGGVAVEQMAERAYRHAEEHTLGRRAERIIAFMERTSV